ncbi:phosphoesterase RecJ-like protein [Desulfobaculum xiamenense]|uniref:Phosphoesterase RecJ-like protein n=1 Tax=Desulfobaculum xiamenense TaxID=995050 RepID=A0A846QKL0_9BACT|nr:bifunctional oligoribonuclease/PAP phosphatase NrnA [Desulfobaculum xiamenense]NJB66992.1 phosphoesterase RecJ-like protein [Desulfobaculum xiamenense]
MTTPRQKIKEILREGQSFLVAAHASPDGDALGSTAALGHLLVQLGKEVTLYNPSGVPNQFDWIDLPCPLVSELPDELPQWLIALDCGDVRRLGDALAARFGTTSTVNIDHHLGNPGYADVNWVDPNFSSVGEMVATLARDLDIPLSGALGEGVYLALVSDTGYFSYGNTHPETLILAAELLREGLDPEFFNARFLNQWTMGRLKLWSRVLSGAKLHLDGRVGTIRITQDMLDETGTTSEDTDGIVNYIRRVKGVKAAVSLREDGPDRTKVSLRSSGEMNVQAIASRLGGGGHKNAAGILLTVPLDEAERLILEAAAGHFDSN